VHLLVSDFADLEYVSATEALIRSRSAKYLDHPAARRENFGAMQADYDQRCGSLLALRGNARRKSESNLSIDPSSLQDAIGFGGSAHLDVPIWRVILTCHSNQAIHD
jgi:hypothetical protein